ncbi:UDP-2,3-diacylglucosamine hydrolase [Novipirellula aureliae]|uniref:UDP-2,3-diacylglucosamine hydrolase n=1 Tax=Novipirellula aureliae TaxID=2527966 RepID=A0A5C6E1T0_9BACT|nr:metallophosphoesterase [Novipirellula aureliae]TWU41611.1 UDP-2,3-diacylglucosamine hydrolase [Novipirellula aureliae]
MGVRQTYPSGYFLCSEDCGSGPRILAFRIIVIENGSSVELAPNAETYDLGTDMIYEWPSNRRIAQAVFVSDLHLMSTRSTAEEHAFLIEQSVQQSEVVVWGGDLFDFRWSRFKAERDSVSFAIEYLHDWLIRFPNQQFVFLRGNHDASPLFLNQLDRWADQHDRFTIAGDILRIGDVVMLHGDQIEGRGKQARFDQYRQKWAEKKRASIWRFSPYDAIVTARAHKLAAALAHRNRLTVKRLSKYLALHDLGYEQGVRRVVFGHTHRVVDGHELGGLRFYSGGAAIRHVRFEPIDIPFE